MNLTNLLQTFGFKPTMQKPSRDRQDCIIQIYENANHQSVTVSYAYEDDYFSIEMKHQSGKEVGGAFEDCLDYELWNDLFSNNIVKI